MREKIFEEHHNINLRFTAKQHEWIGKATHKARISRAEFIRTLVNIEMLREEAPK